MLLHHVVSLGSGQWWVQLTSIWIWGKAGWMYVERKKNWESRPLGSEGRVFFGAWSRWLVLSQPKSSSYLPLAVWPWIWFSEELSLMEAVTYKTIWKSASLLPAGLISPRFGKSLKILLWQVTERKQSTLIIAAISAHPQKPEQTTAVKAPRQQGPVEMRNLTSYENFISWRCGSKNLEVQSRWAAWILGAIVLLLVIWFQHREDLKNLWGHKYQRLSWNIPGWRVVWCRRYLLGAQQTFLHNIAKVMEAGSCWAPVFYCVRQRTIWAVFAVLLSLVLPGCKSEGFVNVVVQWRTSCKFYQDFSELGKFPQN